MFPPGTVHVYRILFDRERTYSPGGIRESTPLHPAPTPGATADPIKAGLLEVTTVTALSRPFQKEFRVTQVPILLLLNENGRVEKRWTGYSPSLRDSLAEGEYPQGYHVREHRGPAVTDEGKRNPDHRKKPAHHRDIDHDVREEIGGKPTACEGCEPVLGLGGKVQHPIDQREEKEEKDHRTYDSGRKRSDPWVPWR
jgi:hypothetical protein